MREQGTTDVRFTDIARVMGMTPPALYRYFADRDELLTALITDAYDAPRAPGRRRAATRVPGRRHRPAAGSRRPAAYREWARREPQQFALVFGLPVPGYVAPEEGPTTEAAKRAMAQLASLFVAAARVRRPRRPLIREVVPAITDCADDKHPELERHRAAGELPGDDAGLGDPARLHLPGGLRPLRLAGARGPRRAVPRPRAARREGGRAPRPGPDPAEDGAHAAGRSEGVRPGYPGVHPSWSRRAPHPRPHRAARRST